LNPSASKNRVWPSEVLKKLPEWFEDEVRKDLSQEEIAQNFQRKYMQKRTFQAIEAKVYYLTGKSPFGKRGKNTSRKGPVSLPPRSSPPLSQPSELVGQKLITSSTIEVQALHLAPNLLPHLSSQVREDSEFYTLHGVQPIDPEPGFNDSHAVLEQETPSHVSSYLRDSQEHVFQSGQRNECPVRGSPQAGVSPKAHADFSDMVPEIQPRNANLINALAATSATSGTVDHYLRRSSPLGSPWIPAPLQSPIRHHSEDDTPLGEPGQTLIHRTGTSAMHVEQTDTAPGKPSERLSPRSSPREDPLARGSANESSNNESHTESGPGVLAVSRASTPFQVPEPSSTGNSTEHHSGNCGMDGPTTNISERALIDEDIHEKSHAQAARSHRTWNKKHLNRLPGWLMERKPLSKERLEVEFLRDFGHYRTSSAIDTACRKKIKADSRHKEVTSAPTLGQLTSVVPAALDITQISRSPNPIIESDTLRLNPSHTIAVPSNENTTLKHLPSERSRSRHLTQSQVGITPKSPARFTAINGGNVHPTQLNISEMTPLVQMDANERDALPSGQRIQQRSTKQIVAHRGDDQNVSQQEGPQSKLSSSNAVFAIAIWLFEAYQVYMCHLTFLSLPSSVLASHTD
jgi:hypothetical protein